MTTRIYYILLVILLLNPGWALRVLATPQGPTKQSLEEKVKAGVATIGTGAETKVKVSLGNETNVRGYISEAKTDEFVVVNTKTGVRVSIPYSQVRSFQGENTRTGARASYSNGKPSARLLIGIGCATVFVVILAVALSARD